MISSSIKQALRPTPVDPPAAGPNSARSRQQPLDSAVTESTPAASPAIAEKADTDGCEQLLLLTASGDRAAFARLYQLTSARLFAAVRRSVWVASEAEEALQEVYLKIWHGASGYEPARAQALTWMLRIARNHSIDHLRRGASRRGHETPADRHEGDAAYATEEGAESGAIDDSPRPDEWLEIRQDEERFDRLLRGLGATQRQVLLLAFRDGCTQTDIALHLDAPLGSVKSWMRRALQTLKATIDAEQSSLSGRDG